MIEQIILRPEAYVDMGRGYAWYDEQAPGLGDRFLRCLDECLRQIARNPDLFEIVYKDYRQAIVRRFPYVVHYKYQDGIVTIYSIFHSSQNPDRWRRRLN
jgi:plasmid stabilization system protein ParE